MRWLTTKGKKKMKRAFAAPSIVGTFWMIVVIAAEPTSTSNPGSGSRPVCPTWYIPVENASAANENCTCGSELGGRVRCKVGSEEVAVLSGYCLTYSEILQQTVVGYCSYSIAFNHTEFKENRAGYITVPKDLASLNSYMCSPRPRHGQLCGKCNRNYGPDMTSYEHQCVKCSGRDLGKGFLFFGVQFSMLTLLFLTVLTFRFNAASASMNLLVFASQTIALPPNALYIMTSGSAVGYGTSVYEKLAYSFYGIWNLDFFRPFLPNFCLSEGVPSLYLVALEYVTPLYIVVLTLATYVCIELHDRNFRPLVWLWRPFHRCFVRFRRRWDLRKSVIDAFATFLLLSYAKVTILSVRLLSYGPVYNASGVMLGSFYYYDGTLWYLRGEHLPFALLAMILLSTVVAIPVVFLLFYQWKPFRRCLELCRVNCQGLRIFVETFQGCYKDGSTGGCDLRFYAGIYLLLRIVKGGIDSSIHCFDSNGSSLILGLNIIYAATSLSFMILRPYKENIYNILNALFFMFQAVTYSFLLYAGLMLYRGLMTDSSWWAVVNLAVAYVFFSLPLIYIVIIFIYWRLSKSSASAKAATCRTCSCFYKKAGRIQNSEEEESTPLLHDDLLPDRLLHPDFYSNSK